MTLRVFLQKLKKPRLILRRVVGDSMSPTLMPGEVVIGVWPQKIRLGDVIIVQHNGLEKIKRVKDLRGDQLFVVGDNISHSTDSRNFGWLPVQAVVAKVIRL